VYLALEGSVLDRYEKLSSSMEAEGLKPNRLGYSARVNLDVDGFFFRGEYVQSGQKYFENPLYGDPDHEFADPYLTKKGNTIYTVVDGALVAIPERSLTAAVFVEYGTATPPPSELLLTLGDHSVYSWASGDTGKKIQADMVAYPHPSAIEAVADMSHPSILGLSLMTAEFSGNVTVSISLDNQASWSEEVAMSDWLNTNLDELFASLPESKRLYLRFILHDDATISRFKITYINS
jgi:hypothetical protein